MNIIISFIICICILIMAYLMTTRDNQYNTVERYDPHNYNRHQQNRRHSDQHHCRNCAVRSKESCADCSNCGYCIPDRGTGFCAPGDERGPYWAGNCRAWEYGKKYGSFYWYLPRYLRRYGWYYKPKSHYGKYSRENELPFSYYNRIEPDYPQYPGHQGQPGRPTPPVYPKNPLLPVYPGYYVP